MNQVSKPFSNLVSQSVTCNTASSQSSSQTLNLLSLTVIVALSTRVYETRKSVQAGRDVGCDFGTFRSSAVGEARAATGTTTLDIIVSCIRATTFDIAAVMLNDAQETLDRNSGWVGTGGCRVCFVIKSKQWNERSLLSESIK